MAAKKKSDSAKNNGELPGFNVGKNATIKEILAEARTFMTPEEYRNFSRKPKPDGGIIRVPQGATTKEIYAIARKNFTAWDLQKYTIDEPMYPVEDDLAEMEEIHRLTVEELNENTSEARRKEIYAALGKILGYDVQKSHRRFTKRNKKRKKAS